MMQTGRRQRGIKLHDDVQQFARACVPGLRTVALLYVPDRLIESNARYALRHAQLPAVVQAFKQMRANIQVRAPALDRAVVEMRPHILGGDAAPLACKGQYLFGTRLHSGIPDIMGRGFPSWVQKGQGLARQETVVEEEGLLEG
jgi:hypothetical protein